MALFGSAFPWPQARLNLNLHRHELIEASAAWNLNEDRDVVEDTEYWNMQIRRLEREPLRMGITFARLHKMQLST